MDKNKSLRFSQKHRIEQKEMVKKVYESPAVEVLNLGCSHSVLTGSLTNAPIRVGTVTVDSYHAGFDDGVNDFKDISFD